MSKTKEDYLIEYEKKLLDSYKEKFKDANKAFIIVFILSLIILIIYRSIQIKNDEIVNTINLLGVFIKVNKIDIIIYLPLIILIIYTYILGKFSQILHFNKLIEKNALKIIEHNKDAEPIRFYDLKNFSSGILGFILFIQNQFIIYFSLIVISIYFLYIIFLSAVKYKLLINERDSIISVIVKKIIKNIQQLTIINNILINIMIFLMLFSPLVVSLFPFYKFLDKVILDNIFIYFLLIFSLINLELIITIFITQKIYSKKILQLLLNSLFPWINEQTPKIEKNLAEKEYKKSIYNSQLIKAELNRNNEEVNEIENKINSSEYMIRFYKGILKLLGELKINIEELKL